MTFHETSDTVPRNRAVPSVIRCESTADLLAALPQLVGFTAENSLFVVFFFGNRGGSAVRLDLPPTEDQNTVDAFADAVCSLLVEVRARDLATGSSAAHGYANLSANAESAESDYQFAAGEWSLAIVVSSAHTFVEAGGLPWRGVADTLAARLRSRGIHWREFCCVAPDGWANYFDADVPLTGRPLSDITHSAIAQELAGFDKRTDDLSALGTAPEAPASRIDAVAASLAASQLPVPEGASPPRSGTGSPVIRNSQRGKKSKGGSHSNHGPWADAAAHRFERLLSVGAADLTADECAMLIQSANHPGTWLVMAITSLMSPKFAASIVEDIGEPRFIDIPINFTDTAPDRVAWSIRGILMELGSFAPPIDRLNGMIRETTALAALAPAEHRAEIMSLAAWAWWVSGMQSVACRIAAEEVHHDPKNALACMVDQLVSTQVAARFSTGNV